MKVDIYEIWKDAEGLKMLIRVSIPNSFGRMPAARIGEIFVEKLRAAVNVGIRRLKR